MLSAPLTARAQEDLEWLRAKLGARLQEPVRGARCVKGEDAECWEVGVAPSLSKGKWKWFYADSLEGCYARIREEVQRAIEAKRRAA
jgi:hypothetical protein